MPEAFQNHYTFPSGAVPTAEAIRDRLILALREPLEMEKQSCGFKGAPRAYANLKNSRMQIWLFWENDRPSVEVGVDEPMERMIAINAAMTTLGGTPMYPDGSWKSRRRYRTQKRIFRIIVIDSFIALAVAIIWRLHWWGLLLVAALLAAAVFLYIRGLARSFRR